MMKLFLIIQAAFAKVKPHKVNEAMKVFSDERFGIDVLKVEVPVNMKYVEGFPDGEVVYTKKKLLKPLKIKPQAICHIFTYAGVSAKLSKKRPLQPNQVLNSTVSFVDVLLGLILFKFTSKKAKSWREWLRTQGRKNIEELNAVLAKQLLLGLRKLSNQYLLKL